MTEPDALHRFSATASITIILKIAVIIAAVVLALRLLMSSEDQNECHANVFIFSTRLCVTARKQRGEFLSQTSAALRSCWMGLA